MSSYDTWPRQSEEQHQYPIQNNNIPQYNPEGELFHSIGEGWQAVEVSNLNLSRIIMYLQSILLY